MIDLNKLLRISNLIHTEHDVMDMCFLQIMISFFYQIHCICIFSFLPFLQNLLIIMYISIYFFQNSAIRYSLIRLE